MIIFSIQELRRRQDREVTTLQSGNSGISILCKAENELERKATFKMDYLLVEDQPLVLDRVGPLLNRS